VKEQQGLMRMLKILLMQSFPQKKVATETQKKMPKKWEGENLLYMATNYFSDEWH
jgi:hypothetical protein